MKPLMYYRFCSSVVEGTRAVLQLPQRVCVALALAGPLTQTT